MGVHRCVVCVQVLLPQCELVLSAREEGSEYDSATAAEQLQQSKDDAVVIFFRKVNKIGFLMHVVPLTSDLDIQVSNLDPEVRTAMLTYR